MPTFCGTTLLGNKVMTVDDYWTSYDLVICDIDISEQGGCAGKHVI